MADRKITDLGELTSPVAADLLPIVVAAEPTAANKNKKIQYGTFLRNIPSGTVGAPSIAFTADTGVTGFYRSAANEIAFTTNSTFQGKFTTQGFQLGTGTAAAQLHLFSNDTTDQVIIENTDAGLDTAPDVVLYRNSASPANNDNLGNLEFRGKDSAGNNQTYAQILSTISTVTNTSEVGILDLMTADAGVSAMRLRLKGSNVGISESNPIYPLHVSNTVSSTTLQLQCTVNDASSGADITMYRRRGASTVGQNNDLLSTIYWRGHNNNATTEQVDYAAITGSIVDVTNNLEDGKLELKVQADGALTTEVAITAANTTLFGRPILPTHTPASSTATGTTGEIAWDSNFIYVATGTNTWRKVGISVDGVPGSFGTFPAGTAAAPSIAFTGNTNTGLFNFGADQISVTTGGTERLRIDSNGQIEAVSLGTAASPTFSFTTDANTGVYSPGADQIALATNGIQQLLIDTTATTSALPVIGPVGSATAPTFAFAGRTNTGIYSSAASTLNLTAGGTLRLTVSTTAFTATLPWRGQNGSAAAPTFSFSGDTNTGIYSTGVADEIAITTGGVQRLLIGATGNSTFAGNVLSSAATGGVGYATGAGGAVTQLTSRTTGVTLNNVCGAITLVSAAGTATWQSFTVTNSTVAATDNVIVNQKSGTDLYMIHVTAVAAGSFRISFATTGGTTTEQPVFNFSVVKAVAA